MTPTPTAPAPRGAASACRRAAAARRRPTAGAAMAGAASGAARRRRRGARRRGAPTWTARRRGTMSPGPACLRALQQQQGYEHDLRWDEAAPPQRQYGGGGWQVGEPAYSQAPPPALGPPGLGPPGLGPPGWRPAGGEAYHAGMGQELVRGGGGPAPWERPSYMDLEQQRQQQAAPTLRSAVVAPSRAGGSAGTGGRRVRAQACLPVRWRRRPPAWSCRGAACRRCRWRCSAAAARRPLSKSRLRSAGRAGAAWRGTAMRRCCTSLGCTR